MSATRELSLNGKGRFKFSLRTLLVLITLVAVGLGAFVYRREAMRPNLEVTPDDILWATDHPIWKMDLTGAGPIYGVSIVVVGEDGKFEQVSGWIGGRELLDTAEEPLVRVALFKRDGKMAGRFSYGGATQNFDATGSLRGTGLSWVGRPERDGDFYHLMSDYDYDAGVSPFSKESHRIALRLLRAPRP
jgi:hypothetical protein